MEFENTSVETQEVAEPVESVETQEVAEPVQTSEETTQGGKTAMDSAFAAQRRALQEAERRIAEMEAQSRAREEAFRKLTGDNDGYINAIAENLGADPDEVRATFDAENEVAKKDLELEALRKEVESVRADKEMQADLLAIQKIDPNIKSFEELGESFINYKQAGLTAEDAYYAIKAKEINTRAVPATPIGKVNNAPPEKDFFTREEVAAMSEDEQRQHYDKIINSASSWK